MKYFWLTLGLLAAGAAGAGWGFYHLSRNSALEAEARRGDITAWLQTEFRLDSAQFAAIDRLHQAYTKVCAQHCLSIVEARRRQATPAEIQALEDTCAQSMTEHFHRVAAIMPAGEGARYLAIVLPRIAAYGHQGAPTLQGIP